MADTDFRTFSPRDFLNQLKSNTFIPPLTLRGWIKPSEASDELLEFSITRDCEAWIAVPVDMIAAIEYIGQGRCDDHSHPFVALHLVTPRDDHAKAMYALLEAASSMASRSVSQSHPATAQRPRFGPACHACMERCRGMEYTDMVNCTHECFWTYC